MASLSKRGSTGSYSIQYVDRDRRTRTISLGKIPQRSAQQILLHVEELAAAQYASTAPKPETSRWLSDIDDRLTAKLAKVGLIETRQSATLGPFIDAFLARREADPNIKASTIRVSGATFKSLRAHFGETQPLRMITRGDAKAWRIAIAEGRAENTVRKWTANAKRLFNDAIDHELISANPFARLKSNTIEVRSRDYFVTRGEATKVLEACPSLEWRLIFALARYGGLRCPSEVLTLRWGDILWDKGRFVVRSSKTEHHEGCETRIVPIFPELMPFLQEAFDAAPDGSEYVVNKPYGKACNLRTQMTRIVERAGLKPWPKIFQNLRSTRATELADQFPGYVAAAWLGHSVKVAKNHYWQVTDDHFDIAKSAVKCAVKCAVEGARNESQSAEEKKTNSSDAGVSDLVQLLSTCTVGDIGFEPTTSAV